MSNQKVDLSILIVSWNVKELLRACLKSLFDNPPTPYTFEVIVVDNASLDGSAHMVKNEFPQVKLIQNDYNYGFAKATNQAYRLSTGKYIMTLNPDTIVGKDTLAKMIQFFETTPNAGALMPEEYLAPQYQKFIQTPPFFQLIAFLIPRIRPLLFDTTKLEAPIQVNYLWGTGIVARREVLDSKDKFYDENLFMYGEELTFSEKIKKKGFLLYLVPNLGFHHYVEKSSTKSPKISYYTYKLGTFVRYYCLSSQSYPQRKFLAYKLAAPLYIVEYGLLALGVYLKDKISPSLERKIALAQWKGAMRAHWDFLLYGYDYINSLNKEIEQVLNDKKFLAKELGIQSQDPKNSC